MLGDRQNCKKLYDIAERYARLEEGRKKFTIPDYINSIDFIAKSCEHSIKSTNLVKE